MNFTKKLILLFAIICIGQSSYAQFTSGAGNITQSTIGNVGIGILTPTAPLSLLEVKNGSVLFDGTTGITPISGAGTRMMWIPSKGAFRSGVVFSAEWDNANLGLNSFASGYSCTASGGNSFACNVGTVASGGNSFACGNASTASGNISFAGGSGNTSSGSNVASFGLGNTAQAWNSFVVGQYNITPGTYNPSAWVGTDPVFVVGNGRTSILRNNALTVLKNGNVLINKVTQVNSNYILDVNGKIRANEIVVNTTGADFVFEKNYNLLPLNLLEQRVKKDKHLSGIASATEMQKNGVGLAELNISLLQKTEELTLYIIELNKRIELLEQKLNNK